MCCYVRHLKGQLGAAGLPDGLTGRREADRRVRAGLGSADAECPDVWRTVKRLGADEVITLLRHGREPAPPAG
jgi:hypothetical protein